MKPSSVVYWSRFFIALATGFGSVYAFKGTLSGDVSTFVYATLAVAVYAVTAVLYRYMLRYGEVELKGKNRYITLGIGTFIFAWMAAVILTYTVLGLH